MYTKERSRGSYPKRIELSMSIALMLVFGLIHAMPDIRFEPKTAFLASVDFQLNDIPIVMQNRIPPPPRLPELPVPLSEEDLPQDAELATIKFETIDLPEPPPLTIDPDEEFVYIPHEIPPMPVAGYEILQRLIHYPRRAVRQEVEGNVIIGVLVDERGDSEKVKILKKAERDVGFEKEAVRIVKKIKWRPAQQHEKYVKVWVAIPFYFRLAESDYNRRLFGLF